MIFKRSSGLRRRLVHAIFAGMLTALLGAIAVLAQGGEKVVTDATLQLWPEYDDPGLLVIYSGNLSNTVTFPQQVAFPVPAKARDFQATLREPDGRLLNESWELADGKLTYTLPGPGFHVEYYVDRPPSGDQREIDYSFEVPYRTDALDIKVQQPARATDFSLTPQPEGSIVGDDGFTYHELRKTDLKPGDKLDFKIRYTKTDQNPSVPKQAILEPTSVAQPSPSPAPTQATSWLPYLLIGLGALAMLGAAAYWVLQRRTASVDQPGLRATHPPRPERQGAGSPGPSGSRQRSGGAAYCSQCGQAFRPDDRYCANCGAPRGD